MTSPRTPALLLGVGLGGFIDGILLHQVLQWHHMLTSTSGHPMTTAAGLEANTLADGLFHVATWICVAAGSTLLYTAWRAGRLAPPRTRARRAAPHRLGPIQPDRRTDRPPTARRSSRAR